MSTSSAVQIIPVVGLPEIRRGDQLPTLIDGAALASGWELQSAAVLVVAQKVVSKSEGRIVRLTDVEPSERALELAAICNKDPRIVELVLRESSVVVRCASDVLIVRHRLGFTVANAGIDQSNIDAGDEHALLLPADPDRSAASLREALSLRRAAQIAVIINDSFGRPWRRGTCGVAIGCAGLHALVDLRGRADRFGRRLRTSEVAMADELAAAASLVMGQAAEGIPAAIIRGLPYFAGRGSAADLIRPAAENLFT